MKNNQGKGKDKVSSPETTINYDEMPMSHKKKLYLDGTCKSYSAVINWLRTMCCFDGSVFGGIPSLDFLIGYPLVEIKVVVKKKTSAKFLFSRKDLYLIAFSAGKAWFQFAKTGDKVSICEMMTASDGSYGRKSTPWEGIGRDRMREAVYCLNDEHTKQDGLVNACHVFCVHLSEAARFHPVEFVVYMSLGGYFNEDTFTWAGNAERESFGERALMERALMELGDESITDFYSQVYGEDGFDRVKRSNYLENLLHSFDHLSGIWYMYSLSNKNVFEMTNDDRKRFYISCIKKNMRSTLAVLCCLKVNEFLLGCERKAKKNKISDGDLRSVIENVGKLCRDSGCQLAFRFKCLKS